MHSNAVRSSEWSREPDTSDLPSTIPDARARANFAIRSGSRGSRLTLRSYA